MLGSLALRLARVPQATSRAVECFGKGSNAGKDLASRVVAPFTFLPTALGSRGGLAALGLGVVRDKQTKRQSYRKAPRSSPTGQGYPNKAHIGVKALPTEYVEAGRILVKQRKYIAKNPHVTRNRHFKIYPGYNVKVMKNTSLQAMVSGRVKMTHDTKRGVKIMNVLPEPREELIESEMWRYRMEHVEGNEENTQVCYLRAKALPVFGREWINQPVGPRPMKKRVALRTDTWNNPMIKDPFEVEPFAYPMPRQVLARHIAKVRRKQAGLPDTDPDFTVEDERLHLFRGQAAQR